MASLRTSTRSLPRQLRASQRSTLVRSYNTAPSQSANSSHFGAGVAGGLAVFGVAYGYYHFSGTKKVVNSSREVLSQLEAAKDKLAQNTPSVKDSLDLLRSVAKTYGAAIPGGAAVIDSTFNQLDEMREKHGPELEKLLKKTTDDVKKAMDEGKGGGDKIVKALTEGVSKLQEIVGGKVNKKFDEYLNKNPELKEKVGDAYEEYQELVKKHGPKAEELATSTYNDLYSLATKGGLNSETYENAQKILKEKSKELASLSKDASSDAWSASAKSAQPILEKMPDVKKLVEERVGGLKGYVGEENVKTVKELYAELEKLAKSGKSTDEMAKEGKKIVESKIGSLDEIKKKAQEKAPDFDFGSLEKYLGAVPGLGGIVKNLEGTDFEHLKKLAETKGEDAEKLLKEAYKEIQEVVKKKGEEAKKLAEESKDDAKKAKK